MMLSHIKSRSDYDFESYKQKNNYNSIAFPNLLTPIPMKQSIKPNFHTPFNDQNNLNNYINKFYSESDKKISENFIPIKRNFNKYQYYDNNHKNKTHEIKFNIPLEKNNKENLNNNNKLILINLMKTPIQQSYRIPKKRDSTSKQNFNKENFDQNTNNNIAKINLNKIKVNFLNNIKKKQVHIQINKSLQHNSSSYALPKKMNQQKQTNKKYINNNINTTNSTINNSNIDDEYFDNSNDKIIELTKEEKEIYGNRNMENYKKIKLLGKGGCGIVWLCNLISNNNFQCAVKQISKKNTKNILNDEDFIQIGRNEINILENLNENDGNDKIPKIFNYYEDNNDIWFSFEKGGKSLSSLSFRIKGEFINNERIYYIQKGKFFKELFLNINEFKYLSKSLIEGVDFINNKGYIHSDIKPENILIEYEYLNDKNFHIKNIKIIDYGSSFYYKDISSISSNTPEYLCPEITNNSKNFLINLSKNEKYINCVDIWSIGITLLELCLGCPIWMNYKAKVIINGKVKITSGLFGCKGRDGNKIYHKQIEISKSLDKILKGSFIHNFNKNDKDNFIDLLEKMLCFDYKKRITTKDALIHKFFD